MLYEKIVKSNERTFHMNFGTTTELYKNILTKVLENPSSNKTTPNLPFSP